MIKLNTYYCKDYDGKKTNIGDILTPYILKKNNIESFYSEENIQLYGIGSLFNQIPQNYENYIWSTGFLIEPTEKINIRNAPYAVRGKYTLSNIIYDNSPISLGDGGLIISDFYEPKVEKKYKLGIVCHYTEIEHTNILNEYSIFKNPDILFINVNNEVEEFMNKINSCLNIISSSLHGLVISDSYNINNSIFATDITNFSMHQMYKSFKFKDYYSVFNMNVPEILNLNENTTIEQCLSHCKQFNKPNINNIKYYLNKSLLKMKKDIIKKL